MSSPAALARQAALLGQPALALTDTATLCGILDFVESCDEVGIRPIIGAEIPHHPQKSNLAEDQSRFVLPVLVENGSGWQNLIQILSRVWFNHRTSSPACRFRDLFGNAEGLFFLTGMEGTELHWLSSQGHVAEAEMHLKYLANELGSDRVVVALEDHGLPVQQGLWRGLHELARIHGLRAVATYGVRFALPEQEPAGEFLRGGFPPETFDPPSLRAAGTACLADSATVTARFANRLPVLEATLDLAERCQFRPTATKKFPCPPLSRGLDAHSSLIEKATQGLRRRLGQIEALPTEAQERLRQEVDDAVQSQRVEMLLVLADLADFCHLNKITLGLGQGRLVSSVLAYALGITGINPLFHNLVYVPWNQQESEDPILLPIEIPWQHASTIADHIVATYGEDFAAFVSEWTLWPVDSLAASLRQWAGSSPSEVDRDLFFLDHYQSLGDPSVETFLGGVSSVPFPSTEACAYLLAQLQGRPGQLQIAPGLIAVSAESFQGLCPLIPTESGAMTQLTVKDLTRLGVPLLKIEPNTGLHILDGVLRWLRENKNPKFDLQEIPLDDHEVFATLSNGRTASIPSLASVTARHLLRQYTPTSLSELRRVFLELHRGQTYPVHRGVCDTLAAYQLAFLLTHFPEPTYAAALTAACGQPQLFHALAEEVRQIRLKVYPPDVTASDYDFTPVRDGIQAGLCLFRQMTPAAMARIVRVRDGAPLTQVRDFVQRISAPVTEELIADLVHGGALDRIAGSRSSARQQWEQIQWEKQLSTDSPRPGLDGESLIQEGTRSFVPTPLSSQEALDRELVACHHLISADPYEVYGPLLKACRVQRPREIRLKPRQRTYAIGNILGTQTQAPLLGDQLQTLVDFEGLLLLLDPEERPHWEPILSSELPIMVFGETIQTPYGLALLHPSWRLLPELNWACHQVQAIRVQLPQELSGVAIMSLIAKLTRFQGGPSRLFWDYPKQTGKRWMALQMLARNGFWSTPAFFELLSGLVGPQAITLNLLNPQSAELVDQLLLVRNPDSDQALSYNLLEETDFSEEP